MRSFFVLLICCYLSLATGGIVLPSHHEHAEPSEEKQKLIVFLLDGFRWDYVDKMPRGSLPGFERIQNEGARALWVNPIFPSVSYPSWTTLSTGLYAESHNIVGNYMYDFSRNEAFELFNTTSTQRAHWWESAEPIWTTATRQGKQVGLFLWQRCDVPQKGIRPALCDGFVAKRGSKVLESNLGKAFEILEQEDYDMVMLYNEHLDNKGHYNGPHTKELYEALQELDAIIYRLFEKISHSSLKHKVNIMIVSDHGMADGHIKAGMKYVNVKDFVNPDDIKLAIDVGAVMTIVPESDKLEKVYNSLKRMPGVNAYKREEIPEEYHYKKGLFVHDILLVAKKGFFINGFESDKQLPPNAQNVEWGGFHGYPPGDPDMRTIFFGWGPAFKSHFRGSPIELVDVYQLYAHILDVSPQPHNGSWDRVREYLTSTSTIIYQSVLVTVSALLLLLT